ncbi:hypothetical protein PIB30_035217 [Stylosanthes scabra]|uniref:Uncharacterized protein n=1 Tax=Stylosanthes scabra TaxID=79078 RepID=A0ABU6SE26_9FABA|nr:hypothetical protein [Stylosanthes scabra]
MFSKTFPETLAENTSSFLPNQWRLRHLHRRRGGAARFISATPSICVCVPSSVVAFAFLSVCVYNLPLLTLFIIHSRSCSLFERERIEASKHWNPSVCVIMKIDDSNNNAISRLWPLLVALLK